MNETSTNIPQGDPRKPSKRLNPRWFLVRFLVFGQPLLIDAALGWWAWSARVFEMQCHYWAAQCTPKLTDELWWTGWRYANMYIGGLALLVALVVGTIIAVGAWWREPVRK